MGLDAGDYSITGNSVSLDTYLSATQSYIDYCSVNGYSTKVFFTTAPVDGRYALRARVGIGVAQDGADQELCKAGQFEDIV
jgi:hypothetical protein